MLDFIEQEAWIESLPKLSPCTPTVLDSHLDTKYWIEEYPGNHAHGNPWFVFRYWTPEGASESITISIPYYAKSSAYINNGKGHDDFCDYIEAWYDWLSYTKSQRQTYVREFRKNAEQVFCKQGE